MQAPHAVPASASRLLCFAGLLLSCSCLVSLTAAATTCGTTSSSLGTSVTTIAKTSSSNTAGVDLYQVTSSGCPGYDWTGQTTPDLATIQNYTFLFPITPVIASSPWYMSRTYPNGTTNAAATKAYVGLAINGVTLYNDANADGADAYIAEKATFDSCYGHNSPNPKGAYHYHSNPGTAAKPGSCVYSDTTGKHSPVFAVMIDGIPLYGVYGDNGVVPTDLDTCRGHTDSTYPFYHYHMTNNWAAPYTVFCLRGCVYYNQGTSLLTASVVTSSTCKASATQYNYSAFTLPTIWTGINAATSTPSPSPSTTLSPSPSSSPSSTPSPSTSSTPSPSPSPSSPSPSSTPSPSTSSTPSPSTSNTSSPSPSNSSSPSPSPSTASNYTYTVQYTFQMDYSSLTSNVTLMTSFKTSIQSSVATASGVNKDYVTVLSLVSGSVVATTQIIYPSSSFSEAQAAALTTSAAAASTFSPAFLSTYSVASVTATVVVSDGSSSSGLSTGAIVGIAVGAGSGVTILAVAAAVIFKSKASSSSKVQPAV